MDSELTPAQLRENPYQLGRDQAINPAPAKHPRSGVSPADPLEAGQEEVFVAMGCFWGAEKLFWDLPGVVTAVGYMDGFIPNPTYEEVCSGYTGHAETVRLRYREELTPLAQILKVFWENHEPDQGDRQGNDIGSQYRSAIFFTTPAQEALAQSTAEQIQSQLIAQRKSSLTTVIKAAEQAGPFYLAEEYHQAYLIKNPNGYCAHGPTGLVCNVGAH